MAAVDNNSPVKPNPSMSDKPWGVDVSTNTNKTFSLQAIFSLFKANLDVFYAGVDTIFTKSQADAVYPKKTDVYTKAEVDGLRNESYQGVAVPSTVPEANQLLGASKWDTTTAGTYTNMGGIVISSGDIADGRQIQIIYTPDGSPVWSKQFVGQNLGGYAQKTEVERSVEFTDLSVENSRNLVDISKQIEGSYYLQSSGNVFVQAGWIRLPYIKINPNTTYTVSGISSVLVGNLYTSELVRTSVVGDTSPALKTVTTFTTGANDYYLGLNVKSPTGGAIQPMLEIGAAVNPWEPYDLLILENKIKGDKSLELFQTNNILFKSINIAQIDGIVSNSYYNYSVGSIVANSSWRRLPMLAVLPNTYYAISGINTIFVGNEYDENGVRIQTIGDNTVRRTSIVFQTSATTKYIGVNISDQGGEDNTYDNTVQVTQSDSVLDYQRPGYLIKSASIFPQLDGGTSPEAASLLYYQYNHSAGEILVYVKSSLPNRYVRFQIFHEVNAGIRADLWRIKNAGLYTRIDNNFVSAGISVLQGGESEFTFLQHGKSDYTGGYHGDEELTSVVFLADGLPLVLTSNIPITAVGKFQYVQASELIETDNATRTVVAYHNKVTDFRDYGYKTFNRIIWNFSQLITTTFFGIVSPHRDMTEFFMSDRADIVESDQSGAFKINQIGGSKIYYWSPSNSVSMSVESRITKALSGATDNYKSFDDGVNLMVLDHDFYAKYYRRLIDKTPLVNDVWEGETIVRV